MGRASSTRRRRSFDPEPLLAWFEPSLARYAWRRTRDPYRILVSEIMLQQTQAGRVEPAFERFLAAFPTVADLARAPVGDVLRVWSGLGYNRRAVSLAAAAKVIVRDHGGRVPSDPAVLRRLPGVGPYTAGAVASIAFGASVAAVDTNVRRVVARAILGVEPSEAKAGDVALAAGGMAATSDAATLNQALMDLGRDVCRPAPRCPACPLRAACRYRRRAAGAGRSVPTKRQPSFQGSFRQLRGRLIRELIDRPWSTIGAMARATGEPVDRVADAVRALAADGMVRAGPAALAGSRAGRVSLP